MTYCSARANSVFFRMLTNNLIIFRASNCLVGKEEVVNCHVPFCATECPEIHDITFGNDKHAQMKAQFHFEKPEVFLGTLINQSVSFTDTGTVKPRNLLILRPHKIVPQIVESADCECYCM